METLVLFPFIEQWSLQSFTFMLYLHGAVEDSKTTMLASVSCFCALRMRFGPIASAHFDVQYSRPYIPWGFGPRRTLWWDDGRFDGSVHWFRGHAPQLRGTSKWIFWRLMGRGELGPHFSKCIYNALWCDYKSCSFPHIQYISNM